MNEYSYQYEYAYDREYCYPDSNVLINKLNIKDAAALTAAEREITSLKYAAAKLNPIRGKYDFAHLKRIHRFLFEDIYPWAGEIRRVNIAKGNQFCLSQHIEQYADTVFTRLKSENNLKKAGSDFPIRLAFYFSEINVLHPFREGNGRTQRLFIEYLAAGAGYQVDFSDVSREEMIVVSAEAFARRYDGINDLFSRIVSPL